MKPVTVSLFVGVVILFVGVVSFLFGLLGSDMIFSNAQWRFMDAASRGDIASMEKLYASGAKVDAIATRENGAIEGDTALVAAADHGQLEAVEWLLKHGANPNRKYADGVTALGAANFRGAACEHISALLKNYGAK